MSKIELTFITEHADLRRDDSGNLIVHLMGVDEDAIKTAIVSYHTAVEAAAAAAAREATIRARVEAEMAANQETPGA